MELQRYFEPKDINWASLEALPSRLATIGVEIARVSVSFRRYPDSYTLTSFEEATSLIREGPPAKSFRVSLWGKHGATKTDYSFNISRGRNIHDEQYLVANASAPDPRPSLDLLGDLLDLTPDHSTTSATPLPRTAFIAHRFDPQGTAMADKVARLLDLLRFAVSTGRGYAPTSIAAKVKGRLENAGIVIVVYTSGTDATWLVQESLLGHVTGKPLIILKEASAAFKPGLLADLEYVPFELDNIESAFIPLIEGLTELGYDLGVTTK